MMIFEKKELLFEIMKQFESANIDEMTLKSGDFEIILKKNVSAQNATAPALIKNENIMVKPSVNDKKPTLVENERIIKAPFLGTYYSAPSPGAEEFVQIGQKVSKGDILCIISAMKVMNDIESDYDGEITEIYFSNDSTVQFGDDLFKIKIK